MHTCLRWMLLLLLAVLLAACHTHDSKNAGPQGRVILWHAWRGAEAGALNALLVKRLAQIQIWEGFTTPITLGALLIATLGFYFWYDGSGVIHDIIRAIIVPRTSAERGTLEASLKIGRYVIIVFGILIVLSVLGFDSTMLAFVTGGLSVGIGFGSQAIIGNLISGILLLFDQSLRPGDVVSVEGQMGVVKSLGIRATTVTTLNNVEVIVPNQTLLTSTVTTYTGSDRVVRTIIPVETHNVSTPHEVREALLAAAQQHPLVADEPAPTVFYEWAGDTSWLFKLAVWFDDPARTVPLTSELYFLIFEEFIRRGIEPSTPQRDLQIINEIPWDKLSLFSSADRHMPVPIDRG